MKTLCLLLLLAGWVTPVFAEPITVKFVGRVTDRSEQLAKLVKIKARIKGTYTFDPSTRVPTLSSVAVQVGSRAGWILVADPSNALSEDPDGRISMIGGNAIFGRSIEGKPVLVMQLEFFREPYTLGFQDGQLSLFYVDQNGVYKTASMSFDPRLK